MQVIKDAKRKTTATSTKIPTYRCESYWIKACNAKDANLCLQCKDNLYLKHNR